MYVIYLFEDLGTPIFTSGIFTHKRKSAFEVNIQLYNIDCNVLYLKISLKKFNKLILLGRDFKTVPVSGDVCRYYHLET